MSKAWEDSLAGSWDPLEVLSLPGVVVDVAVIWDFSWGCDQSTYMWLLHVTWAFLFYGSFAVVGLLIWQLRALQQMFSPTMEAESPLIT